MFLCRRVRVGEYSAYDEALDRRVALKLLLARDKHRNRERMRREAKALARLSHPHVVHVYEVDEHEGHIYVVMEYVEGSTLRQWLVAESRSWRDVLGALIQAGQGLAAAHKAGLVHRDLKPDNVLVGASDGRVRVADFGLARAQAAESSADMDSELLARLPVDVDASADGDRGPAASGSGGSLLDVEITEADTVVGTPAYMSPEQHMGEPVDARGDQFSYCVMLFESLYRLRPFPGRSMSEIYLSITSGNVRDPPPGSRVPAWLHRVVMRGLQVDPNARWPTMDALIHELRRGLNRRRRWIAPLVGTVVVGSAGVGMWQYGAHLNQICEIKTDALAGVWDDAQREAVSSAFAATELAYAAETTARVTSKLDDYVAEWKAGRVEACEATRRRGEQSEELMDARMHCLDRHRRELRALVEVFTDADTGVVKNAVEAAHGLPDVAACADIDHVRADVPPPTDPEVERRVEDLRGRLASAKAQLLTGHIDLGLELALAAQRESEATEYAPLIAEAALNVGRLQRALGRNDEAEANYEDAYFEADASSHIPIARRAAARLLFLLGSKQERYAEALRWGRHVEAKLRIQDDVEDRIDWLMSVANVRQRQRQIGKARPLYERALELTERELGEQHPSFPKVLNGVASTYFHEEDWESADGYLSRAIELEEQILGPTHPNVAIMLYNIAQVHRFMDQADRAEAELERALEIRERALGPDNHLVGKTLGVLGALEMDAGRPKQALEHLKRAVDIIERALGPSHSSLSTNLSRLGEVHMKLGDNKAARAAYERSLEVLRAGGHENRPGYAATLSRLGEVLLELREPEEAKTHAEQAIALLQEQKGDAIVLATARFVLARALVSGEKVDKEAEARAVALARSAAKALEGSGENGAALRKEIQRWLSQRGA